MWAAWVPGRREVCAVPSDSDSPAADLCRGVCVWRPPFRSNVLSEVCHKGHAFLKYESSKWHQGASEDCQHDIMRISCILVLGRQKGIVPSFLSMPRDKNLEVVARGAVFRDVSNLTSPLIKVQLKGAQNVTWAS